MKKKPPAMAETKVRSGVREHPSAGAAAERITPQRLHGEGSGREGGVRRGSLSRGDPRALVADFRSVSIQPPATGELVSHRLGHLVAGNDGDARVRAKAVEVRSTAGARIGHVR